METTMASTSTTGGGSYEKMNEHKGCKAYEKEKQRENKSHNYAFQDDAKQLSCAGFSRCFPPVGPDRFCMVMVVIFNFLQKDWHVGRTDLACEKFLLSFFF